MHKRDMRTLGRRRQHRTDQRRSYLPFRRLAGTAGLLALPLLEEAGWRDTDGMEEVSQ